MDNDVTITQLAAYLDEIGLYTVQNEQGDSLIVIVPSKHGTHIARLRVDAERHFVILVVPQLCQVPADRRPAVGAALAHINYTTVLGKFSMDLRDGELNFECNVPYHGVGMSAEQIAVMAGITSSMLSEFMPLLQRLCWTDETAEGALGLAEAVEQGQAEGDAEAGQETQESLRAFLEALRDNPASDSEDEPGEQDRSA